MSLTSLIYGMEVSVVGHQLFHHVFDPKSCGKNERGGAILCRSIQICLPLPEKDLPEAISPSGDAKAESK